MRFQIIAELERPELPIEYRRVILSLIKKALTEANNGKYFKKFFDGANSKDYTFSVKLPGAKFKKDCVELKQKLIEINFSTFDKMTGYILFAVFSEQLNKKFPLRNNCLFIKKIIRINECQVVGKEVLVRFIAPLVVRQHNQEKNTDWYYSISDENFKKQCLKSIKNQLEIAGFSEQQFEDVNIEPISMKKVCVKHYGCVIPSSVGTMLISGRKSILNYLICSGMGSRRSSGFGMVELLLE